jgi:ubiquinone/menaquinone biosynthesis C-methylase UbiE
MSKKTTKPHSAEYFGEQRDYWWNNDFLLLMAQRWRLDQVNYALDAGCGIGHWGQLLAPLMPRARLVGVDREETWVKKAKERAEDRNLADQFEYREGDVNQLEFPDSTFDMVTCQTVLIHVPDPKKTIQEFYRVLKPGGLLALAEPNNRVSSLVFSNLSHEQSVESIVNFVRFELICERGKEKLGEGNISLGDLLPGYCAEVGFHSVNVYLSDKTSPMIPPYDTREQKVNLEQALDWQQRDILRWDRTDTLRYYLAGGGKEEEFEKSWQIFLSELKSSQEAIQSKKLHCAGGMVTYLISGVKPHKKKRYVS